MTAIRVFDPAMCCSSGVCGPSVDDPQLAHFSADLDWLKTQGVSVERFNLAQQPAAFAEDQGVRSALGTNGEAGLPVVKVNGEIKSSGVYPSRAELSSSGWRRRDHDARTRVDADHAEDDVRWLLHTSSESDGRQASADEERQLLLKEPSCPHSSSIRPASSSLPARAGSAKRRRPAPPPSAWRTLASACCLSARTRRRISMRCSASRSQAPSEPPCPGVPGAGLRLNMESRARGTGLP